jgi:flavin reductase (DIM6/NTAB) family NADH-FMN oxidoreductase RutF
VKEFPLAIECRLLHDFDLGAHHQFIGEVVDVKVEEDVLDGKGGVVASRLGAFCFAPGDGGYYRIGELIGQAFSVGRKE